LNKRAVRAVPSLALTVDEAAAAIGVGRSLFYEQVLPQLRIVRVGSKRLVPVAELERWLCETRRCRSQMSCCLQLECCGVRNRNIVEGQVKGRGSCGARRTCAAFAGAPTA
jgi:excisionase family DNA binding protein